MSESIPVARLSESPMAARLAELARELGDVRATLVPQLLADRAAALLDASTLVASAAAGELEPLAAASDDPAAAAHLEHARLTSLPALGTVGRVLASGESELVVSLDGITLDAEPPAVANLLQELGATSVIVCPLGGHGPDERTIGLLALFRLAGQVPFDEVDHGIADALARAARRAFRAAADARHRDSRSEAAPEVYVSDLLDAVPLEAAVIGPDGTLRATNRRWDEYATAAEFDGAASGVGTAYLELLAGAARRHRGAGLLLSGIADVLKGDLPSFSTDYETAGGHLTRSYSMTVMPLGEAGEGAVITRTDVTMRKALERQLAQRATHDALTGLPNRMLLRERLSHAVVRAARAGSLVAVLFCDLDQFKFVNDTLGHDVGDRVLIAVAERLRAACRSTDSITRFGGDEFVVVAEDLKDIAGANAIAATLLDCLRNPFDIDDQELYFGVSIGVAVTEGLSTAGADAAAILLREADTAMYEAKRAGRNRVVVFRTELREAAERALRLTTSIRAAMTQDQFELRFRPQYDCHSGLLTGAESELFWNHPDLGLLPGSDFVVEAEESGVLADLGKWVVEAAAARLAEWEPELPESFSIGVNLAPRLVALPDLAEVVEAAVAKLRPGRLTLEIPESALSDDPQRMSRTLARLRQTGVRLAIDNFGTGYSSLSYLQAFPVDELKVDRTFVVVVGDNHRASAMVSGISALARALGFRLVADGVESESQLTAVRAAGADAYQLAGDAEPAGTFLVRLQEATP